MSSGTLFIISAPSGAGKTSLVRRLETDVADIAVSVSHTTRSRRPGEIDGQDYFFVTPETFREMLLKGAFLEHACVFDHFYGTAKETVESAIAKGKDVILEIDWQGAQQMRETMPGCVSVFILPPSRVMLEQRLRRRGQDSEEIIARRMRDAIAEMSHYDEYDYLIVNDDFSCALSELKSVVLSGRLKRERQQARLGDLLASLLDSA